MSYANKLLYAALRRQLLLQGVLTTVIALLYLTVSGSASGKGAAYGGLIAVANTLIQLWHWWRFDTKGSEGPAHNALLIYRIAIERFASTLLLFALGLGVLKLAPLPLLSGFIAGQMVLLIMGFKNSGVRRNGK
ncbi:MAG TPA: ATP synthase subunit I [Gammaproteobacteria bacterium]